MTGIGNHLKLVTLPYLTYVIMPCILRYADVQRDLISQSLNISRYRHIVVLGIDSLSRSN